MSAASNNATGAAGEELLEQQVLRKVTLRLLPFLGLLYFINILDRVNIGFARLHTMLTDLNMSEKAYALGAGIFSVSYCLLEVPSNLILSRMSRFLLGCAEAGFFSLGSCSI
jgi:hypothetical protein